MSEARNEIKAFAERVAVQLDQSARLAQRHTTYTQHETDEASLRAEIYREIADAIREGANE